MSSRWHDNLFEVMVVVVWWVWWSRNLTDLRSEPLTYHGLNIQIHIYQLFTYSKWTRSVLCCVVWVHRIGSCFSSLRSLSWMLGEVLKVTSHNEQRMSEGCQPSPALAASGLTDVRAVNHQSLNHRRKRLSDEWDVCRERIINNVIYFFLFEVKQILYKYNLFYFFLK